MANYIQAVVIQFNNDVYLDSISVEKSGSNEVVTGLGSTQEVPCPDAGGIIDGNFWATPVNTGAVTGFTFTPYDFGNSVASKPTVDSFPVTRISSRLSNDRWWILGTAAGYIASCNVCCGNTPVPMPDISTVPKQAGCQTICNFDTNGNYAAWFGLPTISGNKTYFPYGYFNGVALPAATAAGYATTNLLLTFLNTAVTGWAAVGTWSVQNGVLVVTQTSGPGTDNICVAVAAINPSL